MEEQLYKKKGRRYIPIGYSDNFNGFPAEGIWVVYSTPGAESSSCIAQVGQFEPIDYKQLANLIKEKEDECVKAVLEMENTTIVDIVRMVFKTLVNEKG